MPAEGRTFGIAEIAWRELGAGLALLAGFYLTAAIYLRFDGDNWRTQIAPNLSDPLFCLYLLKWVGHEIGRGFAGFWDAPFFYPAHGVLAYSDHLLGPGLVAAAWNALVPGWVGAYNLLFLSSFAWTGWTTSWVLRRSGRSWLAAVLGGMLYAFSPFRWDQVPHLQVLLMAAIPLALWSFDRLLARPSWARAAGFLLCYAAHLSGGCYLAAMLHVPLAVLFCNRLPELRERWRARRGPGGAGLVVLAATFVLAAGLLGATFFEYWRVGARDGLAWSAEAARHWGASLLSFLQPSDSNLYSALWPRALFRSENCLFPGFVAIALCVAGALLVRGEARSHGAGSIPDRSASRWRFVPLGVALLGWLGGELLTWSDTPGAASLARWVPGGTYRLPFALFVSGLALWAALYRRQTGRWPGREIAALPPWPRGLLLSGIATALLSTPLFFLPLSKVIPGLASMRVPARFEAFTMLTIAFFAAAAFDSIAERLRQSGGPQARRGAALFTAAVLLGVLVECAPRELPRDAVPEEQEFPAVYSWIAHQEEVQALIELPLRDPALELTGLASIQAMYFGTLHWRPLVNGFSAHFPPYYQQLEATCCYPMPDPAAIAGLTSRGVTHILVHRSRLPHWQRRALAEWAFLNSKRFDLVYSDDADSVYRLTPPLRPAVAD